ncbi:MAG: AMP-binding protein, partial [Anaerolineae bacterium]|nr:AMP-binding protein [Anaerolineae bacterium]
RYAGALYARGIRARDLVVIAHTQSLESIYAFWGALWIGAIPSMFPTLTEKLDPAIYMRSMAELVQLSGVRAVLTTDDFAPQLAAVVDCAIYGSKEITSTEQAAPRYTAVPDEIAFLQHSSGTTGLQKGVALSHTAVLNQLTAYSQAIDLNARDVIVSWLPLYHDMGLIAGFLLPLVQGIPLVLMSPFDWVSHPAMLLRAIHDYGGTLCWMPNFAYHHCARRIRQRDVENLSLATMRAFINCSEPVHAESHALFAERFAEQGVKPSMLAVSYAMAENTFAVTQTPIGQGSHTDTIDRHSLETEGRAVPSSDDEAAYIVSCGMPIRGTQVKVVDAQGATLAERQVGEVAIRSDCLLTSYYQRPDLNPFTADGWYLTGDRGYVAGDEVYIVGRSKDLIINGGKNIYPQDIEAIVNTVAGVHPGRAVVFGVEDAREGTELIAVVAEIDTENVDTRRQIGLAIRQAVAQQTTVTVSYVHLVDEKWLVKTSSGKIARAANREKWLQERAAGKP